MWGIYNGTVGPDTDAFKAPKDKDEDPKAGIFAPEEEKLMQSEEDKEKSVDIDKHEEITIEREKRDDTQEYFGYGLYAGIAGVVIVGILLMFKH